jgi:hypothetical protein
MRLAVVAIVVAACGDGPGEQTIRGEATIETFVNRMCACTDATCANAVVTEFARWTKTIKKPREDPATAKQLMDRYNACMTHANK